MLRGVNKRIIEVNDTDSDYFEKALFFVKENAEFDNKTLENEARKIIGSYFEPSQQRSAKIGYLRYTEERKKKKRKNLIFSIAGCFVVALFLTAVFLFLF